MLSFSRRSVSFRDCCAALSCLAVIACGGDSKSTPPLTAAGTGVGPTATAGMQAAGGTGASGTGATGTAGTTSMTGRAGTGTTGASGTGTTGAAGMSTTGAGTAGTGTAAAGTGMAAAGTGSTAPAGAGSVLQYHRNATRDGHYVDAALTRAAAAMLKKDPTFMAATSGAMYAQPLYFDAGVGGKDLVITATEANEVAAWDAATGANVWKKTLAMPATTGMSCRGNINPLGVTGTPVIDGATKTLYVAAMTSGAKHQIYALSLEDGSIKPGWPIDVSTVKAGSVSFNSAAQNQRGALLIVGDTLYVPYGGLFGDCGDYHGWVVGVPLNNPAAPIGFATKAIGGGIWAPGGLASDGTSVFAATGNTMSRPGGLFTTPSEWGHGDAVLRLSKDLKDIPQSATMDFFAAQNWMALDQSDLDIGGSGPVLITVPGVTPADWAIALGKDGAAYLLDRANLGGMGGEKKRLPVSDGTIIQAAAAYTTAAGTFVAFRAASSVQGCGSGNGQLGALKLGAGSPPSMSVAWCAVPNSNGSPIATTTDGKSDSIVWIVAGGKLLGFNGEDGTPVYNGGGASDGPGTIANFQTPIVAKGRIFVGTNSGVVAYTTK